MVQHFQTLPEIGRSGLKVCTILKSTKLCRSMALLINMKLGTLVGAIRKSWGLRCTSWRLQAVHRPPHDPPQKTHVYNMCHNVGIGDRSRRFNSLVVQLR